MSILEAALTFTAILVGGIGVWLVAVLFHLEERGRWEWDQAFGKTEKHGAETTKVSCAPKPPGTP